jgi:AraC-like DNA-binding protein
MLRFVIFLSVRRSPVAKTRRADIFRAMEPRDPLADVLGLLRLPRAAGATFHAVTEGTCWVRVPGHAPRELQRGDVVLLPTGAAHVVASHSAGPARDWDRAAKARTRDASGRIVLQGAGGATHLLCAAYEYDRDVAHPLLTLLPPVLSVSAADAPSGAAVEATVRLLRGEMGSSAAGWGMVLDRLIDVLFVQVVRAWVGRDEDVGQSWLTALRDPLIARALGLLHAEPAAPWTIERLARHLNLSRATLGRRFTALVGESPLAYLTRWRMDLAAAYLRETDDAASAVARRVGYTSEFAFSRAFSRVRGQSPGRYRREARRREARGREARREGGDRAPAGA